MVINDGGRANKSKGQRWGGEGGKLRGHLRTAPRTTAPRTEHRAAPRTAHRTTPRTAPRTHLRRNAHAVLQRRQLRRGRIQNIRGEVASGAKRLGRVAATRSGSAAGEGLGVQRRGCEVAPPRAGATLLPKAST